MTKVIAELVNLEIENKEKIVEKKLYYSNQPQKLVFKGKAISSFVENCSMFAWQQTFWSGSCCADVIKKSSGTPISSFLLGRFL